MFRVALQKYIARINSTFYRLGVWHREDVPTVGERRLKFFYSCFFFLLVISLATGARESENLDELIIFAEYSLIASVLLVKLLYIIWRKKQILELLNCICVYSIEDDDTYKEVNDKLNILMKFVLVYLGVVYFSGFCIALVVPFLGTDKTLFFNIGFPLDWKNNEFAYWIAFTFMFLQTFLATIPVSFSAIIWYLMINCSLKFQVLGQQIKTMGRVRSIERIGIVNDGRKVSDAERDNLYFRDLLDCIASHTQLKELTNELDDFFSELFVAQLTTSALCICCSVYCLAFSRDTTSVEYVVYIMTLFYNIFDIFMIMNFGNEIELTSDRLSYCLFESDWVDRPQSTKKIVLYFGEFLMQPHQLVVLKLYPLNLDTFMRILNSAYSSFNILQNFK